MSDENKPQYYLKIRGRQLGPFDIDRLREMVQQNQVSRVSLISEDGNTWVRASKLPELFVPPQGGIPSGPPEAEAGEEFSPISKDGDLFRDAADSGDPLEATASSSDPLNPFGNPYHESVGTALPQGFGAPAVTTVQYVSGGKTGEAGGPGESNVLAIISLVAGVLSLTVGLFCLLNIPLGLAAVICGIIGILNAKKSRNGFGLALAGTICGTIALIFLPLLLFLLFVLANQ